MNHEYIKLDKYNGIVTDENGKADFVSVMDYSNIEDILVKENELEYLNNKLKKCNGDIKNLKFSKFVKPFFSGVLSLLFLISLFIVISKGGPLSLSITILAILNIPVNIIPILLYGTYIGNRKKEKNLNFNKESIEREIKVKTENLEAIKKQSSYKRDDKSIVINKVYDNDVIVNNPNKTISYKKKVLRKQ